MSRETMGNGEFDGRVAIVTGGGRGIGRSIALALARKGASVVVNALHAETCGAVAREIEDEDGVAIAIATDVADWRGVDAMVSRTVSQFARIDILVNNAGILRPTAPLEDIPEKEWELVMDVNVKGAFNCTKAVLPIMKKQRTGKVVNVSSIAGRSTSNSGGAHYTTSKAALLGFTRHAARESARYGINVNAVAPAGVDTEMVPQFWSRDRINALVDRIPVGRLATPDHIADLVVFLVSQKSDYITGATIDINGGLLMI